VQIASFADVRASFPNGIVLSRQTGVVRGYGITPYQGYDSRTLPYASFFPARSRPGLPAMERVLGAGRRTYAYRALARSGVVADGDVVLWWRRGTRSVLDAALISRAGDVGSAGAFVPAAKGRRLHFSAAPEGFRDAETGSVWTVLGVATSGPLAGQRLEPVTYTGAFWFAWAAFAPSTVIAGM
jgi:hypothetical protein